MRERDGALAACAGQVSSWHLSPFSLRWGRLSAMGAQINPPTGGDSPVSRLHHSAALIDECWARKGADLRKNQLIPPSA